MTNNMQYNDSQLQAINHFNGPCMVLASAGTGKTAVITRRTYKLIHEYGADPSGILVITYTKAAAQEMKQRFLQLEGAEGTRATFGTFHAVFFSVLKAAYHFTADNIVSEKERQQMIRRLIAGQGLDYRDENELVSQLLGEISVVKNERIPPEHFYSKCCGEQAFRAVYQGYERCMRKNRKIDFDDMLLYTWELFAERPDILGAWQKKYRYILVDEFQDINRLQFEILRMLALPENNLFIVGDDDQSIYRFRGAKPELMLRFPEEYPTCRQILLDTNYRSGGAVLRAAMRLIAHNKERYPKEIRSAADGEGSVMYRLFPSRKEQNLFLVRTIADAVEAGSSYGDFAVLFRTNLQSRLLTEQLLEHNIPVRMRERIPNLYEHWIARDVLTYIRIAQGSRERSDFLQIMNRPVRYIGRDSLCESTVGFDAWKRMYDGQPGVAERIGKLERDIGLLRTMSPYAAVNYIRRGIGYDDYLKEYAASKGISAEELFDILEELAESARCYKSYERWERHMEEFSGELERMSSAKEQEVDAVTLATMHGAKGLEYENVFLVDVNEGIMPYKKAVLERDIEEERRLFFVGMTRAKRNLYLFSVSSVEDKKMAVSRFVKESQSKMTAVF